MSSPQAKRQKARVEKGLCGACGEKRPTASAWYCDSCEAKHNRRARKRLGCSSWVPGGRGRPPRWFGTYVQEHGRVKAERTARRRAKKTESPT